MKQFPGSDSEATNRLQVQDGHESVMPFSIKQKMAIVLAGLNDQQSISEICRREGIEERLYQLWSTGFLGAGESKLDFDAVPVVRTVDTAKNRPAASNTEITRCTDTLRQKIERGIISKAAVVGVIGQGYVGLPLALEVNRAGYDCLGFDTNPHVVNALDAGQSPIDTVAATSVAAARSSGSYSATTDFTQIQICDIVVICVPTPIGSNKAPVLKHVFDCCKEIATHAKTGTLVILESTSFPFTTADVIAPLVSSSGLQLGKDIAIGYSPEREDPGSQTHSVRSIPRLTSGLCDVSGQLTAQFYQELVDTVVPVSSPQVAEAAKLTENIFRSVNIALVNELKTAFERMDIDIWEVIEAAGTKPFGFMKFQPGPGVGGHCIPVDPYYLIWKAKEFGCDLRLIETAALMNDLLPGQVGDRVEKQLSRAYNVALSGNRVVVVGIAYKPNLDDVRESPGLKIMQQLRDRGADVAFIDHHVQKIPPSREYPELAGLATLDGIDMSDNRLVAVLIATDHDDFDYGSLLAGGVPIFDTRNAMRRRGFDSELVIQI